MASGEFRASAHRSLAILALAVACLAGPAAAGPVGLPETFEGNAVGSFPAGWSDVATVEPTSTAPKPSAVVVTTTDAFGNPTKAVATLPKVLGTLPATRPSQGIYRPIAPMSVYSTTADIRIDRFSDVTDFDCGCPPAALSGTDSPMQAGFTQLQGTTDFSKAPFVGLAASSRTKDWRLLAYTANLAI